MKLSISSYAVLSVLMAVRTDGQESLFSDEGSSFDPEIRPYLVYLSNDENIKNEGLYDGIFCGASLISPRAILTAASCVTENAAKSTRRPRFPPRIVIPAGIPPVRPGRGRIVTFPKSNSRAKVSDVDVAVLLLPMEDAINDVTPIRLNDDRKIPVNRASLDLAGLGANGVTTSYNFPMNETVTYRNCPHPRDPYFLCTVDHSNGMEFDFVGDKGGPLVLGAGEPYFGPQYPALQVGIVSEQSNVDDKSLAKYVRASAVEEWVIETVCTEVRELCPEDKKPNGNSKASKSNESKSSKASKSKRSN